MVLNTYDTYISICVLCKYLGFWASTVYRDRYDRFCGSVYRDGGAIHRYHKVKTGESVMLP